MSDLEWPFKVVSADWAYTLYPQWIYQWKLLESFITRKGGSRGREGPCPPPVVSVCNIFCAWLLAFTDIPRSLHPSALSTELLKVSELPHLSLTLTLAQPRCNGKPHTDTGQPLQQAACFGVGVSAVTSEAARILQSPASGST